MNKLEYFDSEQKLIVHYLICIGISLFGFTYLALNVRKNVLLCQTLYFLKPLLTNYMNLLLNFMLAL